MAATVFCFLSHPQVAVELVQNQAHGPGQVAHVRGLLVQSVLENLKVLHPFQSKAVIDDVRLQDSDDTGEKNYKFNTNRLNWGHNNYKQQHQQLLLFVKFIKEHIS